MALGDSIFQKVLVYWKKKPYWVSVVCVMSQDVRGQGNYVRLFFRVSYFSRHVAPPLVNIINYHY